VADLDHEAIDLVAALAAYKERRELIEKEENGRKVRLMEMLGDREIGNVDGETVVTWKTSKRSTLDTKRLKAERPEITEEFTKTSETRTFLPKYKAVI
jgi:predicted phage-related endonuclease